MIDRRPLSTRISLLALAVLLSGLSTGCREGTIPTTPAQQATLSIQASSAGAPAVSAVRVTLSSIALVPTGGGNEVEITAGSQSLDLIQLQQASGQILLTSVPTGSYASIRFRFDATSSDVVETSGATPLPLTITAPVTDVPLDLQLSAGDQVTLQLAIDAASSLLKTTGGDWVFTPFLQITAA